VRIGFANRTIPPATDPLISLTSSNVSQNDGYAIRARGRRAQVLGSTLIGNEDGGVLAESSRFTAAANELTGLVGSGAGFSLLDTESALSGNQITDFEEGGIHIVSAKAASVVGNVVVHNGMVGIAITDVADVTVHENQVTQTQTLQFSRSGHGLEIRYLAAAPVVDFVSIRGNLVSQNEGAGIHLSGVAMGGKDDPLYVVATNGVFNNRFIGINIENVGSGRVEENRIEGNRGFGIRILEVGVGQAEPVIDIEDNQIAMTSSAINANDDQGDCLVLIDSNAAVRKNRINSCERAGILVSGGSGSVAGNLVQSSAILLGSQDGSSVAFDTLPQAVEESILREPL
jgi:nitrous oxidase accessory protein NosD